MLEALVALALIVLLALVSYPFWKGLAEKLASRLDDDNDF